MTEFAPALDELPPAVTAEDDAVYIPRSLLGTVAAAIPVLALAACGGGGDGGSGSGGAGTLLVTLVAAIVAASLPAASWTRERVGLAMAGVHA